jgi:hypothetical protein
MDRVTRSVRDGRWHLVDDEWQPAAACTSYEALAMVTP